MSRKNNLKKKSTTFRGFSTERARRGTFRGFSTERAGLGTFRGFGTERARLGTFRGFGTERTLRGFGTERARLGTFRLISKKVMFFSKNEQIPPQNLKFIHKKLKTSYLW